MRCLLLLDGQPCLIFHKRINFPENSKSGSGQKNSRAKVMGGEHELSYSRSQGCVSRLRSKLLPSILKSLSWPVPILAKTNKQTSCKNCRGVNLERDQRCKAGQMRCSNPVQMFLLSLSYYTGSVLLFTS